MVNEFVSQNFKISFGIEERVRLKEEVERCKREEQRIILVNFEEENKSYLKEEKKTQS